jgi:hypothetical protein
VKNRDDLPSRQAMKAGHKVRRFRRSNAEHGNRKYLGTKQKPWASHNPTRSAA